ncbi:MAG: MmcQ/YjbR family DNA-binding protein [Bacteroidota bacterium]
MVSIATFRQMALSFPGAIEQPHFEKISFRVKKKIFATLSEATGIAVLKLSLLDQSVFCAFDKEIIYPVPGAWGRQGWTMLVLKKIKKNMLKDALTVAYSTVG